MELSSLFKDVASIIAEKCINPKDAAALHHHHD